MEPHLRQGYTALMGQQATLRLHARERALMRRFHLGNMRRQQNSLDNEVAAVHARTAKIEAMNLQMWRKQVLRRGETPSSFLLPTSYTSCR